MTPLVEGWHRPIGWAIVELLGHRRLAGWVDVQDVAGVGFLAIGTPIDGRHVVTLCPPASVYAITPTDEATAREAAAQAAFQPGPISPWGVARREPTEAELVAWLADPEFDRLLWAIARARGRSGGSTREDEELGAAVLSALRGESPSTVTRSVSDVIPVPYVSEEDPDDAPEDPRTVDSDWSSCDVVMDGGGHCGLLAGHAGDHDPDALPF